MAFASPGFIGRYMAAILLPLLLFSCAPETPPSSPAAAPEKQIRVERYGAATFIKHLALASLELAQTPPDMPAARPHLDIIRAYDRQPWKKEERQPVVTLEYATEANKDIQQLAVPFILSSDKAVFPSLLQVMRRMQAMPHTLHDLKLAIVIAAPNGITKSAKGDASRTAQALDRRSREMLERSVAVALPETAKTYFRLAYFFTEHQFRDAAYLAVDHAKQALAEMAENGEGGEQDAAALSRELEALENDLRQAMPFTFITSE